MYKLHSNYVAVDVKRGGSKGMGYSALKKRLEKSGPIPVTIRGSIVAQASGFDGVSIEFEVIPEEVLITEGSK